MLAKDSVSNYEEQLQEETEFVSDQIHKVVETVGPRESGCESEHKAQDYVAELMSAYADDVKKEPFSLHPKAFMGWVTMAGVLLTISTVLLLLSMFNVFTGPAVPIICLVLSIIMLVSIIGEFLLYREFLDPFFPKKDTYNVVSTRKATGETKRRIVFDGHIDSAYEWHFTYWGGGKCLTTFIIYAFGSMFVDIILTILKLCGVYGTATIVIAFLTIPAFLLCFAFLGWHLVVPGANDNLTGVFASASVLRFLEKNDIRFEHTEVVALSSACEEAGLRGAKAYAKAHAKEFADSGVETIVVCTDTLRDFDDMGIYNKDMSGTVKLDPKVADLVRRASQVAGLDLPYANVFFGSSNAAAMVQGGLPACCLAAMDPTPARYYHTRLDTPDNLDEKTIKAGIDTLLETLFMYDAGELEDNLKK